MGAMIMNLASNVLGLGNAATPFGLKAMTELQKLNRTPASASDAMVLFLAINATSVSLFPLGVIGIRASMGVDDARGDLGADAARDRGEHRDRDRALFRVARAADVPPARRTGIPATAPERGGRQRRRCAGRDRVRDATRSRRRAARSW